MRFNIIAASFLGFILSPFSHGIVESGPGSESVVNNSNSFLGINQKDKTYVKILKGAGLVFGAGVALLGGGFLVKKGVNLADHVRVPGETTDEAEQASTAQTTGRGGRQRAM